jgi:ABC-type methionine transport system ATPase subunit
MDIVRSCCSQVLGMQAGRVIASGTPDEVFESAEYREAVVGTTRAEEDVEEQLIGAAAPERKLS